MISEFDIYPYVGALPVRFGTPRDEVPGCLGGPARPSKNGDYFGSVRVGYRDADVVAELGFAPMNVTLSFLGERLWDSDEIRDPMPLLLRHDPAPIEFYGFVIFLKIGVTCGGFHDDDHSQRGMTVFRRGLWDDYVPQSKIPDLSRYRL